MRIGIIGMGQVGKALGRRWATAGHEITFGVRDPDAANRTATIDRTNITIESVRCAAECPVILLAVPWRQVNDALMMAGSLTGKVLMDCTNPVNSDFTGLVLQQDSSAGERVAQLAPGARVVKIFNTNGVKNMSEPNYGRHKVTMLYAGDDEHANETAAQLAAEIGFDPIKVGALKYARLLEPLAMSWIVLSRHSGLGVDFALNVVRRSDS